MHGSNLTKGQSIDFLSALLERGSTISIEVFR
jgi:hypothetical protein